MKTIIREGRLWQIEKNKTLPENIRQAIMYYHDKFGETFGEVRMRPEDRERMKTDMCQGVKLISDTSVLAGHLYLTGRNSEE